MRRTESTRRLPALVALAAIVVPLAIAGCGGGSSSSSSSTTGRSSAATAAAGGRRGQIAACLRRQGLTPPQRRPGGGGGPFFGGAGGPSSQRLRDALRKCGITRRFGRRTNSPQFRQAVSKFVACVRSNGYNLPAPNLSGKGPVFDPSKVNQRDPKFMAAARKCQRLLRFRRPGAPPGAGAGSA